MSTIVLSIQFEQRLAQLQFRRVQHQQQLHDIFLDKLAMLSLSNTELTKNFLHQIFSCCFTNNFSNYGKSNPNLLRYYFNAGVFLNVS